MKWNNKDARVRRGRDGIHIHANEREKAERRNREDSRHKEKREVRKKRKQEKVKCCLVHFGSSTKQG